MPERTASLADLAHRLAALVADPVLASVASAAASDLGAEPLDGGPADRLAAGFALSPFERDVVTLVGLPEEHEALSRAVAALHPRGEPWTTPGMVAAALELDAPSRRHLRRALDSGPLRRHRLVQANAATAPWPEASLRLAPSLWSALRGHDAWPDELDRVPPAWLAAAGAGPAAPDLRRAVETITGTPGPPVVVVVTGPHGRTVEELAAAVADELAGAGRPVVFLAGDTLDDARGSLATAHAVVRGAVPVVVGCPPGPALPDHPGSLVVCAPSGAALQLDRRALVAVDLGERTLAERAAMWTALLPELDGDARVLAGLLRVDPVRAGEAVHDARVAGRIGGAVVDAAAVIDHTRRRTDQALPASVRLVRPTATWSDLVTTPTNHALLRSVVDRVQGQVQVLHDWGFDRAGAGRGVRALLAGPPGTGKTLSAHVLAAALGLDLLAVDLSALVSKWLGETEKNIAEVFAAAERTQAVLFFDEADAIFGRRTDASDAQARWANLETAYLLARLDQFDGLVVLATNLRANIDDAFVRRLDVIVDYDEPDLDERCRLWQLHLPDAAPVAADVDAGVLAQLYPITGGLIANASLDAAFTAAAGGEPIGQRHLLAAVEREYRKAGRTFPGRPRAAVLEPRGA